MGMKNMCRIKIKMEEIYRRCSLRPLLLRIITSCLLLSDLLRTRIFNFNLNLKLQPPPLLQLLRLLLRLRLKGREAVPSYHRLIVHIILPTLPTAPIPMILLGRGGRGVGLWWDLYHRLPQDLVLLVMGIYPSGG